MQYFGIRIGVLVARVVPDGPAAKAGLRAMDIVQKIDEVEVQSASDLTAAINSKPANTPVHLEVRRGLLGLKLEIVTAPFPDAAPSVSTEDQTLILKIKDASPSQGAAILEVGPSTLANRSV